MVRQPLSPEHALSAGQQLAAPDPGAAVMHGAHAGKAGLALDAIIRSASPQLPPSRSSVSGASSSVLASPCTVMPPPGGPRTGLQLASAVPMQSVS